MSKLYLLPILATAGLASAQETPVVKQFAGCYGLRVVAHPTTKNRDVNVLPKRFQLTSHASPYRNNPAKKLFRARNLDPKIRWDLPLSYWTVTEDGYLEIDWSTGYVGYGVKLGGTKTPTKAQHIFGPTPIRSRWIHSALATLWEYTSTGLNAEIQRSRVVCGGSRSSLGYL